MPPHPAAAAVAAQPLQTPRPALKPAFRPTTIPVLPLQYTVKKKQHQKKPASPITTSVTTPPVNLLSAEVFAKENSKPTAAATSITAASTVDSTKENGILNTKVKKETAVISPLQETNGNNQGMKLKVEEEEKSGDEQIKDSDKSSTLASQTRPSTVEPQSSTIIAPPFPPSSHVYKHDDLSSFSSPRALPEEFGMRTIDGPYNYASTSHSPSPHPSILGDSQPQYALRAGGASPQFINGFPPLIPPPHPSFFHPHDLHTAQRQMPPPLASPAGYSPSITTGMSDQQQFPSYASSVQNELETNGPQFYKQVKAAPNGHTGHANGFHASRMPMNGMPNGSQPPLSNGDMVPQHTMHPHFPPHSMPDHLDGLLDYLLSQFNNPRFADYTLELHYSDSRHHPVSIPGHNLLFARSPVLNNLMATTTSQLSVDGMRRFLRLETDDRFVTSEGFRLAVSRLYGGHLLDEGGASRSPGLRESPVERFNHALGYAASGHVLHIPPVVDRGIMVAMRFIGWETLEKAVDFAMDGGLDSHWTHEHMHNGYSRSTYGSMCNELLLVALDFAIRNFPANFDLDTTVLEFRHNSRLPRLPQPSVIQSSRALPANPKVSSIKFGDLSSSEDGSDTSNPIHVLSKLLVSLPFPILKFFLENTRLGNVEEWATTGLRQEVMHCVIGEREKRRMKVRNSPIPNSKRSENRTHWEAVGWKEHIVTSSSSLDQPTIVRDWVDFIVPEQ